MFERFFKEDSEALARIEARLIRIESRLCQLMMSGGMDPDAQLDRKVQTPSKKKRIDTYRTGQ